MKLFDVYPLYNVEPVSAHGFEIIDAKGDTYFDFYGGHAVISIGHSHPHYVKSLTEQLNRIGFYSNSVQNPLQNEVAQRIAELSGLNNYQLFFNWCQLNNTNIIQFTKTETNIENFCYFINKQYKTKLMLINIELTEKCYHNFIKHYSKHKSNINYLLTNMRMSICELG